MLEKLKAVAWRGELNYGHCATAQKLKDGVDLRTLQQWMGHRDIASTTVYLKGVRNSDIQARINKGSLAAFA